jgi:hypothetical protein
VSDWTWEYDPNASEVVGGLSAEAVQRVEDLAGRLCDAASAQHLGEPPIEDSGVSGVYTIAEDPLMVWYLEHRRHRAVYIINVADRTAS